MEVLLIEDNPDDATYVRECLDNGSLLGCQLTHVADLSSGLALCDRCKYDVVLLDLSLPDTRGLDTVRRMHAANDAVAIVVLTGLDDEQTGLEAIREGAQDYLVKRDLGRPGLLRALRYARERKRMEDQLRQAQKMEAVGRLAGGVAHDINNMMTVVIGYSDLLLHHVDLKDRTVREPLEHIKQAGERAASVTQQLLAFSRKQILQPVLLNLNSVVNDMEKMLRYLIRSDIEFRLDLDPALQSVKADRSQMEVVLTNLVLNARDALPRGGKLAIKTRNTVLHENEDSGDFECPAGAYSVLLVSDNGSGLDEPAKAHLFEPFYAAKGPGKGTGLGLASVYGIIKQTNGCIKVESAPGRGTTFEIYLPQVKEEPKSASALFAQESVQETETVLVAEGEPSLRRLIRDTLKTRGYTVLEAKHGTDALRIAREHAGPIQLLIADVIMPEMNGPELNVLLSSLRPNLRVLYLSGYSEHEIANREGLHAGLVFLQKPFSPSALVKMAREVLDRAKPTN